MDTPMTDRIFGQSILDKYRLNCWWEEAHDVIITMNMIFVFLFGLSFRDGQTFCMPSTNGSLNDYSTEEADFVAAHCRFHEFKYADPEYIQFLVVFVALSSLANSRFWFITKSFKNIVSVYNEAEKRFKDLSKSISSQELKKAIFWFNRGVGDHGDTGSSGSQSSDSTAPSNVQHSQAPTTSSSGVTGDDSRNMNNTTTPSDGVKDVAENTNHTTRPSNVIKDGDRNTNHSTPPPFVWEVLALLKLLWQCKPHPLSCNVFRELVITASLASSISLLIATAIKGRQSILQNTYSCVIGHAEGIHLSDTVFQCTRPWSYHDWLILLVYGVLTLVHFVVRVYGLCKILWICHKSSSGVKATGKSQCCWGTPMDEQSRLFISNKAKSARSSILYLNELAKACRTRDDRDFTEFVDFVFSSHVIDFIHRLPDKNKDEGQLTDIVSYIIGDKSRLTKESISKLIEEKKWKNIVELLNTRGETIWPDVIDETCYDRDSENKSLLYYALHRDNRKLEFSTTAVKTILRNTKVQKFHLYDSETGKKIPAEAFVEKEYKRDLSYPLELKKKLLQLIKRPGRTEGVDQNNREHNNGNVRPQSQGANANRQTTEQDQPSSALCSPIERFICCKCNAYEGIV